MPDRRTHETTSPTLLLRVRDPSDQASWTEFEARYRELIRRYCLTRGLQPADMEDVRQTVFLNLAKGLRNFDYNPKRGRFRSYLGHVVRNAIVRHLGRKDPALRALDTGVVESASHDAEMDEAWEREWANHHYRLAMERLRAQFDPRSLQVFGALLAGRPAAEVAGEYAMAVQAVHQVRYRIKTRLQELIAAQVREEDEPELGPI